MKQSIITQDGDIINYDHVVRIAIYTLVDSYGDDSEAAAEIGVEPVYVIRALTVYDPIDEDEDNSFPLGRYEQPEQAEEAMEQLIKWLGKGVDGTFRMPK